MELSKELQEMIKIIFEEDEEFIGKLLLLDAEAIRQVGIMSQQGIEPKEVVYAYESNDKNEIKNIYNQAKRQLLLQKLYKRLCTEYCKQIEKNEIIKVTKIK